MLTSQMYLLPASHDLMNPTIVTNNFTCIMDDQRLFLTTLFRQQIVREKIAVGLHVLNHPARR